METRPSSNDSHAHDRLEKTLLTAAFLPLASKLFKSNPYIDNPIHVKNFIHPSLHLQAFAKSGIRNHEALEESKLGPPVVSSIFDLLVLPFQNTLKNTNPNLHFSLKLLGMRDYLKNIYRGSAMPTIYKSAGLMSLFTQGGPRIESGFNEMGVQGRMNTLISMTGVGILAAVLHTPLDSIENHGLKNAKLKGHIMKCPSIGESIKHIFENEGVKGFAKNIGSNVKTGLVASAVVQAIRHRQTFFQPLGSKKVDKEAVEMTMGMRG